MTDEKIDNEDCFPDREILQYLKQELLHSAYQTIRHINHYTFSLMIEELGATNAPIL